MGARIVLWGMFEVALTVIDTAFFMLILNGQIGVKNPIKKIYAFLYGVFVVALIFVYNFFTQSSPSSVFCLRV